MHEKHAKCAWREVEEEEMLEGEKSMPALMVMGSITTLQ
jgi:hypothetical protein